jgi:hypothetical protein
MLNPGDKCDRCGYVMGAAPKREDPRDFMTPEDERKVAEFFDTPCTHCGLPLKECPCGPDEGE